MLAALLRSFNALEFLKLHNCESQVLNRLTRTANLNRLRSPAIPALVTDNRFEPQVIPALEQFLCSGRKPVAHAVYSEKV